MKKDLSSFSLLALALLIGPAQLAAAASITYVDAVFTGAGANTTLANGTAMNLAPDQASLTNPEDYANLGDSTAPGVNFWIERPRTAANGGSVFVAPTDFNSSFDVPVIKTTITGLVAGAAYNVFGFYWDRDQVSGNADWDIQFGLTEAGLTTFPDPGLLASGSTFANTPNFVDAGGLINLAQANLGAAVASAGGTIDVYVNDGPSVDRSWYDGVGYELVPEPASLALLGLGLLFTAGLRRREST